MRTDRQADGGSGPWRAWARAAVWRELAYALAMPLMAGIGVAYLLLVLVGVLLAANVVGLPVLALCAHGARGLGAVNRGLARVLAGEPTPAPAPFRAPPGLLNWFTAALCDVAGWRAVIHSVVRLPAAALAFGAAATLWAGGLFLLGAPLWAPARLRPDIWPGAPLLSVAGLALLLLAPAGVHLALGPERLLARTLLGPAPGALRIRTLEETRARAVLDADAALRRIERDLHDGTAARLVTLAMSLGMAQEELAEADRPERLERARALVGGAHSSAKEILAELRDLIRGIHPPALDKGLEVALATLAARTPLPVELDADLPVRPSPAVESIAFYCTAELLANVVKHSGARHAAVEVRVRDGLLVLTVRDDGRGGAVVGAGSGLRGLAERVAVVDGAFDVRSPAGGPTVVTVRLPLHI
ncbi:sensor histidine kinase [Nonomuraea sp. SYSU D8015]|uniref:sensor histidine kinase n=1 Tax=Nonomuraea sp. SYSU D8015 TaxID=2593644 RepID=UPI00166065B2|nr:sensor domain-containing protein [Nonomuraea sp. SYSU D8015]